MLLSGLRPVQIRLIGGGKVEIAKLGKRGRLEIHQMSPIQKPMCPVSERYQE